MKIAISISLDQEETLEQQRSMTAGKETLARVRDSSGEIHNLTLTRGACVVEMGTRAITISKGEQ